MFNFSISHDVHIIYFFRWDRNLVPSLAAIWMVFRFWAAIWIPPMDCG